MAEMYQSSQHKKNNNASESNTPPIPSEAQKGPENLRTGQHNNKMYFNEEPFYTSVTEANAMKQPTAPINYFIQPQKIDVEMLKGGFGPEVLAFSNELNRNSTGPPIREKRANDKNHHQRIGSHPTQNKTIPQEQHMPPMNPLGDQYQHFNLQPGMFGQPMNMQNGQFQQLGGPMQPQVHFIANQQKFYQISPAREVVSAANNPGIHMIYGEKRPYTSSSMQQQIAKRNQGNKKQSSAIAALYLGPQSKVNHQFAASNGFKSYQSNELANQPILHTTPFQQKKRMFQNNSMPRKANYLQPVFTQNDHEQLYEEAIKVKQVCQQVREENHRLKMKVKMLEVEMLRKEKSLEDYLQQSTFIQNAQRNAEQIGQTLAPIAQTAQKYQQETYLVLSLKKQVKELKQDLMKNTEILEKWRRNAKVTRLIEMEAEIDLYKDEMQRMRSMINLGRGDASQIESFFQPNSQEEFGIKFLPHTQSGQDTEEEKIINVSDPSSFSHLKYGEADKNRHSTLIQEIQTRDDQIQKLQEQVASLHGETMKKSAETKLELSLKAENAKLKKSLKQEQEKANEFQKQLLELQKQLKAGKQAKEEADNSLKELNEKLKVANAKAKDLQTVAKIKDEKTKELEEAIGLSDSKIKQLQEKLSSVKTDVTRRKSQEMPKQKSGQLAAELCFVAPILAASIKMTDRITLAELLKQGFPLYQPGTEVAAFLKASSIEEIAFALPKLALQKAKLESYDGEESVSTVATLPEELTTGQKQYILAQNLVKINGMEVYINTVNLKAKIQSTQQSSIEGAGRGRVGEEQLLDIAEVVFVRIADAFVKNGSTVRETFGKYSITDLLPDQSTVLDLLSPLGFLEALKNELKMEELSEIEVACLMRVLAKPELENQIILNEFALIMENFGVPLVDQTILSEEDNDYIADGAEKPKQYNLNNIDVEGLLILRQVARFLLSEYLHPREFFGKMVKPNVEVQQNGKTIRLDQLKIKDFYLKIKIANIRKTLEENQSLNDELCLDQVNHPTVFNMKWFVRALEDIAEVEQERLVEEERYQQAMLAEEEPEQELANPTADYKDVLKKEHAKPAKSEDQVEREAVKIDNPRFTKGKSRAGRSPNPISKFQALGTIEEAISENATSHPEKMSSGDMTSNNLRFSNNIDSSGDNMPKVDLLSKSFNIDGQEFNHRRVAGLHSTTSEQMRATSEEMFSQLQVDIPEMHAAPISTDGSRRNDKGGVDDYQDDQSFEEDN